MKGMNIYISKFPRTKLSRHLISDLLILNQLNSLFLGCFLKCLFCFICCFRSFLTKLILLLPDRHLSKCFFPFACYFTFSIPLLAMLKDFQQTLQKALVSSLSSLCKQVLNSSSTIHESRNVLLYLGISFYFCK